MLTNYYTLSRLVTEWQSWIEGATVEEIYSQQRGELIVALRDSQGESRTIQISVQAPLRYLSSNPKASRAKKNVASVFSVAEGSISKTLSISPSDRLIDLVFKDESMLRIELFGPNSNVYLTDSDGIVVERFRKAGIEVGDPVTRAIPIGTCAEMLAATEGTLGKRIRKAAPLLGSRYVSQLILDADLDAKTESALSSEQISTLEKSINRMSSALDSSSPRIYWKGPNAHLLSLFPLALEMSLREELFETVDEAVRVFIRRKRSQTAYDLENAPLQRTISSRLKKAVRSQTRLLKEVEKESRAKKYEQYGHLLMASQQNVKPGQESVTLDDILSGGGQLTIPLRSELSAVQNAERYYERARESRQARIHSEKRLAELGERVDKLQALYAELNKAETATTVKKFKKRNSAALAGLSSQGSGIDSPVPYRCYQLADGYEVWVGRNAKQNDRLTTRDARKYDLWLHARGVAGSHTVLRVPRRQEVPPARIVEKAAAIAAWHSKARTSEFAPVIVVERKYVRKPRKSPLGTVVVEREEVLIVKPELPEE